MGMIEEAIARAKAGGGGQLLFCMGPYSLTVYQGDDEECCFHVHEIQANNHPRWIAEFIRMDDAETFLSASCAKLEAIRAI